MYKLSGHSLTRGRWFIPETQGMSLSERDSASTVSLGPDAPSISFGEWILDDAWPEGNYVWRVKNAGDEPFTETRTIELEHVIKCLDDIKIFHEITPAVITGSSGATTCTAKQAAEYLLSLQSDWELGDFEFSVTNPYEFNGESIYDGLEGITETLENAVWEYDVSVYPFRLHIRQLQADTACEMRGGRNLSTLRRTVSRSGMYTRIYPTGANNLHIDGEYLSNNENLYGRIDNLATDQSKTTKEALQAWAAGLLRKHSEPTMTVNISGLELSSDTGEELDRLKLNRVCRCPLPNSATAISEKIVRLQWRDRRKEPDNVNVSLCNETADVSTILRQESRRSGKAAKGQAKQNYLFEANGQHLYYEIFDDCGHLHGALEMTSESLRIGFDNAIESTRSEFHMTAESLRISFENEIQSTRSEFQMTSESLRIQFENDLASTRSEFQMTSESLRIQFENDISSTRSELHMTSESLRIGFENGIASARSEFQMTAESLRVGFENDLASARSEFQMTAESLRVSFEDDIASARSEFQMTAESLRVGFENDLASTRSEFQMTAESLRVSFEDDIASARSEFQMTAESLRVGFENDLASTRSEFQMTAESLRVSFEDDIASARSEFQMTAESLRVSFENDIASARSEFQMTSESLRVAFEDDIASARSEFQMSAESLRVAFENDIASARSEFQMTSESLRVAFEDDIASTRSEFQMTAESLRVAFENEAESLRTDIDIQAGRIGLVVTGSGSSAGINIQAIADEWNNSQIDLNADRVVIGSGSNAKKVKVYIDGKVSAVEGDITYLTTGTTKATLINADNLTGDYVSATQSLYGQNVSIGSGTQGGSGSLYYRGAQYYRQGVVLGPSTGYFAEGHFLGDDSTTLNLNHYHTITAEEGTGTDAGKIILTLSDPVATSDTSNHITNFNIADTTTYKNGVLSARNNVSVQPFTANPITGTLPDHRTFTYRTDAPTPASGTSQADTWYLTGGTSWSSNKTSVALRYGSDAGVSYAILEVDAGDLVTAATRSGKASVGLTDPEADPRVTLTESRTFTVSTTGRTDSSGATDNLSKEVPLHLYDSGTAVYLKWGTTPGSSGTSYAKIEYSGGGGNQYADGWTAAESSAGTFPTSVAVADRTDHITVRRPNATVDADAVVYDYYVTSDNNTAYIRYNGTSGNIVAQVTHNKYYAGKASVTLNDPVADQRTTTNETRTFTVSTSGRTNGSGSADELSKEVPLHLYTSGSFSSSTHQAIVYMKWGATAGSSGTTYAQIAVDGSGLYGDGWTAARTSTGDFPTAAVAAADRTNNITVKRPSSTVDGTADSYGYYITSDNNVAYIRYGSASGNIVAQVAHNKYYAGKASVTLNDPTADPRTVTDETRTFTVSTSGRTNGTGSADELSKKVPLHLYTSGNFNSSHKATVYLKWGATAGSSGTTYATIQVDGSSLYGDGWTAARDSTDAFPTSVATEDRTDHITVKRPSATVDGTAASYNYYVTSANNSAYIRYGGTGGNIVAVVTHNKYYAGKAAVTLNDPVADARTTTNETRTFTVSTSGRTNGSGSADELSKEVPLHLYTSGSFTSNKAIVYLKWGATAGSSGTTYAQIEVDASSVATSATYAGKASVTLNDPTWNARTGELTSSRTVTVSTTGRTNSSGSTANLSKDVALFLTQSSWSSNSLTVYLRAGSETGTAYAKSVVDGSGIYTSGYNAGWGAARTSTGAFPTSTVAVEDRTDYITVKRPSATVDGTAVEYKYYVYSNKNNAYIRYNSASGAIQAMVTHGQYDAGWTAARNSTGDFPTTTVAVEDRPDYITVKRPNLAPDGTAAVYNYYVTSANNSAYIRYGSTSGPIIAHVVHNKYYAGKAAVTLNDPVADARTTTNETRTFTVSTSGRTDDSGTSANLSKDVPLHLYTSGSFTSNKAIVYLKWGATAGSSGTTYAQIEVDASSVATSAGYAGRAAVTLADPTWNARTGELTSSRTVTVSTSGRTNSSGTTANLSKDVALFLTQSSWSSNSLTVYLRAGSESGTAYAKSVVDGSGIYTNGYNAGWGAARTSTGAFPTSTVAMEDRTDYITVKRPSATVDGEATAYKYYVYSNKNNAYIRYNSASGAILAMVTHGQYDAGWGAARDSTGAFPTSVAADDRTDYITVKRPNATVDGTATGYSYYVTSANNAAYIRYGSASGSIVAVVTHNKYYAGKASVTLNDPTWDAVTGALPDHRTITVTTSGRSTDTGTTENLSKSTALYLTASGLTVTLRTGSTSGTSWATKTCSDSNLKAANIKSGVTIFGVTGSYAATVANDDIQISSYTTSSTEPTGTPADNMKSVLLGAIQNHMWFRFRVYVNGTSAEKYYKMKFS